MRYTVRSHLADLVLMLFVLTLASCRGLTWSTPKPPAAQTADAQTSAIQKVLLEEFAGDWYRQDGDVCDILIIQGDLSFSRIWVPVDCRGGGYNGRVIIETDHFHLEVDEEYVEDEPITRVPPRIVAESWIPVRWGQERLLILDADLPQFCAQPDMGYCEPGKHGALHVDEGSSDSCQYWIRRGPRISQLPEEEPVGVDGTPLCR